MIPKALVNLCVTIFVVCVLLLVGTLWGVPQYKVYSQQLSGEAKLREAESSRQIAVEEAKAKLEASKLLSQAEVERAKGVAEANKIIGGSLKENREYLTYLWLESLKEGDVIYVPTEANLPLLEATRLQNRK